jgi:hypothetical protein
MMRLLVEWGDHSPRLDRLLAAECSHCDGLAGCLVRHDARAGGAQVWLARCRSARDHNIAWPREVLDPVRASR